VLSSHLSSYLEKEDAWKEGSYILKRDGMGGLYLEACKEDKKP